MDKKIADIAQGAAQPKSEPPKSEYKNTKEVFGEYEEEDEHAKEIAAEKERLNKQRNRLYAGVLVREIDRESGKMSLAETKSKSKHQISSLYTSASPPAPTAASDVIELDLDTEDQQEPEESDVQHQGSKKRKRENEDEGAPRPTHVFL